MGNVLHQSTHQSHLFTSGFELDTNVDSESENSTSAIYNPNKHKKRQNQSPPLLPQHHPRPQTSSNRNAEKPSSGDSDMMAGGSKQSDHTVSHDMQPKVKVRNCQDCTFKTSHWMAAFTIFSILNFALLALLVTVATKLAQLSAPNSSLSGNESCPALLEDSAFCLPCANVYLTELEVLENRFKITQRSDTEKGTLCCAQPHNDLDTFLGHMYLRTQYPKDRANGKISVFNDTVTNGTEDSDDQRLPGIRSHLLLQLDTDATPTEANGTHTLPLRLMKRSAPAAHGTNTSLIVHQGSVKIIHSGLFYIHSQVRFALPVSSPILSQYVVRVRNDGEQLLLENSVLPCDDSVESCEHSFVAGLFVLEAGDQIVLRVSDYSYVDVEKDQHLHFGVHRV